MTRLSIVDEGLAYGPPHFRISSGCLTGLLTQRPPIRGEFWSECALDHLVFELVYFILNYL